MRRFWLAGVMAVLAVAGCSGKGTTQKELLVYCGSTMKQPMEAVAKAYLEKTGVRVILSFGDSGQLLTQAEQRKEGDGLVVHDPFATMAEAKGLAAETGILATLQPAIGVQIGTKGEQEVKTLADLAKPGIKIGVPDPNYATAGKILAAMLAKAGLTDAVMKKAEPVNVQRSSGDLVNALSLGNVDAVVAWDAVILRDKKLKCIPIAENYRVDAVTSATGKSYPARVVNVTLTSLKSSKDPAAMAAFLKFATGPEGRAEFQKLHFGPVE
jgi:molybdate transport system substrate-binding protein